MTAAAIAFADALERLPQRREQRVLQHVQHDDRAEDEWRGDPREHVHRVERQLTERHRHHDAPTAAAMIVHTTPSTGCFINAGDDVSGHRSKCSIRNMPASIVT